MTEPAPHDDSDIPWDDADYNMTLADYVEIIENDIDEAADQLSEADLEKLCEAIRKKIDDIDPSLPF
jgi:hypothetical protein